MKVLSIIVTLVYYIIKIAMWLALAWFLLSTFEVMIHNFFNLGSTYTGINFWTWFVSTFA